MLVRLEGPQPALDSLAKEILAQWPGRTLAQAEAAAAWDSVREFLWAHEPGELVKIPITPKQAGALSGALGRIDDARLHLSSAGNVAFVSLASESHTAALAKILDSHGLRGLTLRGSGPLWYGNKQASMTTAGVKSALDPMNRFVSIND